MAIEATGEQRRAEAERRALDALGGLLPDSADAGGWVSVAEAADASGVSTSTIRYWYRHGSIPTQRAEGDAGRYLVPLDAVMARAARIGEEGDAGDDDLDMDAVYWSAEAEKARKEADGLRDELEAALERMSVLERRVAELEAELDSLEIIDDDLDGGGGTAQPHGYRGAARPQDPDRELIFDDEHDHVGLPSSASDDLDEDDRDEPLDAPLAAPEPELTFEVDPGVFEDDVLPQTGKKRRK